MKHLAPACFRAFSCAAGSCPDSCCRAGWEILPDEETLARYQTLPGEVGARVRAGILPGAEPLLRQDADRVCVLLDPDGLCCVQRHFGHEALCRVCRDYPRFRREFGGLTEHGVSLSCPTAYALAVSAPPAWEEWEDAAPPVPNELDAERYLRLRRGRALALNLLARAEVPLGRRLMLVWRLAVRMQNAPEALATHDYGLLLRRWETAPARTSAGRSRLRASRAEGSRGQNWQWAKTFAELEILSPAWKAALERFLALAEADALPDGLLHTACPEVYARWLWYSLYKYWLDALDDGDLRGRVERSLCMTLLGLAMDRALPGQAPFLRRLSREIEHCEENLTALLTPVFPPIVLKNLLCAVDKP